MIIQTTPTLVPEGPRSNNARQLAEQYEGVFLNTLVKEMTSSLDARGAFGGGFAEETWRGMQSEMFANEIARSGGIGLADQIMDQLLKVQQAANAAAPSSLTQGAYK